MEMDLKLIAKHSSRVKCLSFMAVCVSGLEDCFFPLTYLWVISLDKPNFISIRLDDFRNFLTRVCRDDIINKIETLFQKFIIQQIVERFLNTYTHPPCSGLSLLAQA